jgi:hypothetical protein
VKILFSKNEYDYEGDLVEECIHLHVENFSVKLKGIDELHDLIEQLKNIHKEIEEN